MPSPLIIRLQAETFDPGSESNQFIKDSDGAGAAITFTGLVRSLPNAPITALELEHFPSMAQAKLEALGQLSIDRFELVKLTIIHRFGKLLPQEPIVQVMALSAHRQAAFDGANFVMDTLKTDAPFWKKEHSDDGASWVGAKVADDDARDRWSKS